MICTPSATSLQLARAEYLAKVLSRHGWTRRRTSSAEHPGAVGAASHACNGIGILILSLGGRHGQIIEIIAEGVRRHRNDGGRRVREVSRSWRLTAYDPPTAAILSAALTAHEPFQQPNELENAGWTVTHAQRKGGTRGSCTPPATRFTRPDGVVTATFHVPTYNPPCEHCDHHGELGDVGGWIITGPGFTVEATAHVPPGVIGAFVHALPGDHDQPAKMPAAKTPLPPSEAVRR